MATTLETIGQAPYRALDDLARAIWVDHAAGRLADAEAQILAEAIEARRRALKRPTHGHSPLRISVVREGAERAPAGNVAGRAEGVGETPTPRAAYRGRGPRQLVLRIPTPARFDRRKSIERRRRLAYSGPMPRHLAAAFTVAEVAVLRIVADEHRDHGRCDRSVDELAARSGTSRSTVKRAIATAKRLGLIHVEERRHPGRASLTNVIRIVSTAWLTWIARGPKGGGVQNRTATEKTCFTKGLVGWGKRAITETVRPPHEKREGRDHRADAP